MGYKAEDDTALVKNLSKGNILAFNTLFKRYSIHLYRFSFGYLKSDVESEEIVQEVFTRIWEKRSELKYDLSFRSYLYTITFNIIKRHFRTKAHLKEYFQTQVLDNIDLQTSQNINYNSLKSYVSELVDKMPDRRKEIFIKSRFEGLSIAEIAEKFEISHKTVENHLTSALKYLRSCLKRDELHIILFVAFFFL